MDDDYMRAVKQFAITLRNEHETFFDHFERVVKELFPDNGTRDRVFLPLLRVAGSKVTVRAWVNSIQDKSVLVAKMRELK